MLSTFKEELFQIEEEKDKNRLTKDQTIAVLEDQYNAYLNSIIEELKKKIRKKVIGDNLTVDEEGNRCVRVEYSLGRETIKVNKKRRKQLGTDIAFHVDVTNFDKSILKKLSNIEYGYVRNGVSFQYYVSRVNTKYLRLNYVPSVDVKYLRLMPLFTIKQPRFSKNNTKIVELSNTGYALLNHLKQKAAKEGIDIQFEFLYTFKNPYYGYNADFKNFGSREVFVNKTVNITTLVGYKQGGIEVVGIIKLGKEKDLI